MKCSSQVNFLIFSIRNCRLSNFLLLGRNHIPETPTKQIKEVGKLLKSDNTFKIKRREALLSKSCRPLLEKAKQLANQPLQTLNAPKRKENDDAYKVKITRRRSKSIDLKFSSDDLTRWGT